MRRLGEKVRVLRERRGLTVRELAMLIGVNAHSHVVQIETGKRYPSLEVLVRLMQVFQVSCDLLLNDAQELDD
jgi:transcriptional regulator with XRE-family HTH domain